MANAPKRGIRYEKQQAKQHHGKHIGGPGRPDYQRGSTKGEVKNWARPVHSGVIKDAAKKGVREIVSKEGFTNPAVQLAKQKGVKLLRGRRRVT